MKLNGKHTGLQAGDIFKIWEVSIGVTFQVTRNGEKLEFESDSSGSTRTYILIENSFCFIKKLEDLTGFHFNQIEGETVKVGITYLLA
ncbi:MAG: hypothetical protein WCT42_00275 [Candidatus Paceibacterota bacterium]